MPTIYFLNPTFSLAGRTFTLVDVIRIMAKNTGALNLSLKTVDRFQLQMVGNEAKVQETKIFAKSVYFSV